MFETIGESYDDTVQTRFYKLTFIFCIEGPSVTRPRRTRKNAHDIFSLFYLNNA